MADRAKVRKAVIPAAGVATRFLPATKAQPKAMLPLVDKPAVQYVVEEARQAGIDDVLVVTGRAKQAIEDHFDRSPELEAELRRRGKLDLLEVVEAVGRIADVHYVRQKEPKGLGHAVSLARQHVGDEAFAVLLADDILDGSWLLEAMLAAHYRHGASVLALMEVSKEEISSLGCAEVEPVEDGVGPGSTVRVTSIVEKPPPGTEPSNLAVVGRYVLKPSVFGALERTEPGIGGEIQLTDAIGLLMQSDTVLGYVFDRGRYDVGNKLDWLKATIEFSLARPDLGPGLRAYLTELLGGGDGGTGP